MDSEKNYKDAFVLAKDWYNDATTSEKERCLLAAMFPELKESEDERIRKWLIEMVEELREANPTNAEHNGNCSEALAYLEKQKEPLTPEEKMNHPLYLEGFDVGKKVGEVVTKPAEWSEEDEKLLDAMIDMATNSLYEPLCPRGKMIVWLKSFRPQPKKELSIEKAIKWLDDTFCLLDNSSGRGRDSEIITHDFDSLEEMYDSFRKAVIVDSEPSWKPSEEQINALNNIILQGEITYVNQTQELITLKDELQKLL